MSPAFAANDPMGGSALPVVLPLVGLTALGWASLAASPWLIQWPMLLIALNPRMVFLLLVAPKLGLAEFTLVATARLCVADPFSYMLGVRYGGRMRSRLDKSRLRNMLVRITKVERTACAAAVWIRPSQMVLVWSGSMRMSARYVALSDVATTLLYVVLIHQGMTLL